MHHWHRPLGRRCGVVRLGRTKQYYVKVCPIALNGNGRACEEGWQAENSMWNLCVRSLVPSALSLLKQMLTTTWIRIRIFIRDKDSAVRQQWPKLPDRYKLQEMIMTTAGLDRSRLASEFRNKSTLEPCSHLYVLWLKDKWIQFILMTCLYGGHLIISEFLSCSRIAESWFASTDHVSHKCWILCSWTIVFYNTCWFSLLLTYHLDHDLEWFINAET